MSTAFESRPLEKVTERPAPPHAESAPKRAADDDRFRLRADFWRTLAHPKRLQILEVLGDREANVSTIAGELDLPPVNVSQELAPLRGAGLVKTRREGKRIFYRLASPKVRVVCGLVAEVMREVATARATTVIHEPNRTAPSRAKGTNTHAFTAWKS